MILITAFEPFGGEIINTSAEVLFRLPDRIGGEPTEKLLLPVVFGKAAETVLRQTADRIFLMGEAGGRTVVTPETKAKNFRDARIPDNEGNQPRGEVILADGPACYTTRLPVKKAVERMKDQGYAISVSEDAGSYVCNDTFYIVGLRTSVPVGFIHVPHQPENANLLAQTVLHFMEMIVTGKVQEDL